MSFNLSFPLLCLAFLLIVCLSDKETIVETVTYDTLRVKKTLKELLNLVSTLKAKYI